MREIDIYPRSIRRVTRVYLSEYKDGLKSKNAFGNFFLYVHYDPENKIYFAGGINKIYSYTYSNDYNFMVKFVVKQLGKRFPLVGNITNFLGKQAGELIMGKFCTIDEISEASGKDKKIISNWLSTFPGVKIERKGKTYSYHIKPLYPQLMNVHNTKEAEYEL